MFSVDWPSRNKSESQFQTPTQHRLAFEKPGLDSTLVCCLVLGPPRCTFTTTSGISGDNSQAQCLLFQGIARPRSDRHRALAGIGSADRKAAGGAREWVKERADSGKYPDVFEIYVYSSRKGLTQRVRQSRLKIRVAPRSSGARSAR